MADVSTVQIFQSRAGALQSPVLLSNFNLRSAENHFCFSSISSGIWSSPYLLFLPFYRGAPRDQIRPLDSGCERPKPAPIPRIPAGIDRCLLNPGLPVGISSLDSKISSSGASYRSRPTISRVCIVCFEFPRFLARDLGFL